MVIYLKFKTIQEHILVIPLKTCWIAIVKELNGLQMSPNT